VKILKNPAVWLLVGLLLVAAYGNYSKGRELDQMCILVATLENAVAKHPTPKDELDAICFARQGDDVSRRHW